jgi:hypothetical protein
MKVLTLDVVTFSKWIVSTLGNGSNSEQHLRQLFQALESYYHTANYGRHSPKLIDFLSKLVTQFVRRLHR